MTIDKSNSIDKQIVQLSCIVAADKEDACMGHCKGHLQLQDVLPSKFV